MTPKEKARELYDKYEFVYIQNYTSKHEVKQCALIAVDEIIEAIDFDWMEVQNLDRVHVYWQQVKQELEQL
jgi:hypothetical protein